MFWSAHSIPLSKISHAVVRPAAQGEGDTAWFDPRSRQIVFTHTLADSIFKLIEAHEEQDSIARMVFMHEGLHSSQTRFWPQFSNNSAGFIINHLEDWRINRMPVSRFPEFKQSAIRFKEIEVDPGIRARS